MNICKTISLLNGKFVYTANVQKWWTALQEECDLYTMKLIATSSTAVLC